MSLLNGLSYKWYIPKYASLIHQGGGNWHESTYVDNENVSPSVRTILFLPDGALYKNRVKDKKMFLTDR
jgi:hypothetical protein